MTQSEFLACIEYVLRLAVRPFTRAELQAYVASMWPHIEEDPDTGRWEAEFLEAERAATVGSEAV
jgi:hypothetical protein